MISLKDWYDKNIAPLASFYILFYAVFFGLLYRYIRRRKALKTFVAKIAKQIMEIRRLLQADPTNKDIFSEIWFEVTDRKRQIIKNMTDYILIDDFYSELRKRNLYLSSNPSVDESQLLRYNVSLLAAAENALNKIEWNKYR
jgi:hypothetical protein